MPKHWLDKGKQSSKKGRKTEKSSAKKFGGRCVPNSGAIEGAGGDFEISASAPEQHDFLVEHKHTDKKSFRVTTNTLEKIAGEAYRANRRPALMVHFEDGEEYLVIRVCDTSWEIEQCADDT